MVGTFGMLGLVEGEEVGGALKADGSQEFGVDCRDCIKDLEKGVTCLDLSLQ